MYSLPSPAPPQISECEICGSLAVVKVVRPYCSESHPHEIMGLEEVIKCPTCGERAQGAGVIND